MLAAERAGEGPGRLELVPGRDVPRGHCGSALVSGQHAARARNDPGAVGPHGHDAPPGRLGDHAHFPHGHVRRVLLAHAPQCPGKVRPRHHHLRAVRAAEHLRNLCAGARTHTLVPGGEKMKDPIAHPTPIPPDDMFAYSGTSHLLKGREAVLS